MFLVSSLYIVGIYYVSYDLAHLWSIKSLPESASLISNSSIWSHRVILRFGITHTGQSEGSQIEDCELRPDLPGPTEQPEGFEDIF